MAKDHGYVKPRGKRYCVKVYRPAAKRYVSFTADTKAEAQQLANQKYHEFQLERGQQRRGLLTSDLEMRMSELLAKYQAEVMPLKPPGGQRAYEESLRLVRAHFLKRQGDPKIAAIHAKEVQAFLSWARVHGERVKTLKTSTVNKHRSVLSAVLGFAAGLELIPVNPVTKVKSQKADARVPVILTEQEYELLLAACDDPMTKLYTMVLGEAGLRADEPFWMKFGDIDLDSGFLTVGQHHRTKSGKTRQVPLTGRLLAAMKAHAAQFEYATYHGARSPWLFHRAVGGHGHQAGERIERLRRQVQRAARTVGISG